MPGHLNHVVTITEPDQAQKAVPLVFDSPHSGRFYPADFDYSCPHDALVQAEDNHVDRLFDHVSAHGAFFLKALFPRTYIDVNRAEDDIDPDLLDAPWPHIAKPSARSHAGIGLIRRIVKPGIPVYSRKLGTDEIRHRINDYYKPYHAALAQLIRTLHYNFGESWHVNCHSMPSPKYDTNGIYSFYRAPDFVLGDRDGTTCAADFTYALKEFLQNQGYYVAVNNPYKGVELVRRYAAPDKGRHSLQLEINKALYWDDARGAPNENYAHLQRDLEKMTGFLASYCLSNLRDIAAD